MPLDADRIKTAPAGHGRDIEVEVVVPGMSLSLVKPKDGAGDQENGKGGVLRLFSLFGTGRFIK